MKKLMIFCVTLSIAAISGAVVLKGLIERQLMNPQLVANEQALAGYEVGDGDKGTCGYISWTGDTWACECNITQSIALAMFDHWGCQQNWCCDSCPDTAYCSNGGQDYCY